MWNGSPIIFRRRLPRLAIWSAVRRQFRKPDIFPTTITSCNCGQKAGRTHNFQLLCIRMKTTFINDTRLMRPKSQRLHYFKHRLLVIWCLKNFNYRTQISAFKLTTSENLLYMHQCSIIYRWCMDCFTCIFVSWQNIIFH
jgi:hypothetical protein